GTDVRARQTSGDCAVFDVDAPDTRLRRRRAALREENANPCFINVLLAWHETRFGVAPRTMSMPAALTLILSCAATTLLLLATSMTPGGAPVGSWLRAGADTASRIMAPDTAPRPMQLRAADRGEDDAA